MSEGRPLPAECARLAAVLRELKERTGLSLAALGGRTAFSKSSWERYLNGKKLPPREAVEALCALADEPPGRPLALWELAEQRWSGRAASAPGPGPGPEETDGADEVGEVSPVSDTGRRPSRRVPGRYLVIGGAALAVAVLVPLALLGLLADDDTAGGAVPGPGAAGASYAQSFEPGCRGQECEGADAQAMGCGAQGLPVTLATRRSARGQRVEIRYAEKCGAVWAKATGLRLGDRVELTLPGAGAKEVRAASRRDTEVYLATAMTATDDPRRARVCLRPAEGAEECFTAPRG
ncbi:helix-turn-helix domain-containing protein [Streptomyces huiliensis]|uniref:helix-turn-helix domain-containing protein n=1 Tax=Streptomyces huiliensis TaxID=2876027 RepID=UPI001CBAE2A2|nr:XRE family transcriptional regulator [Streptomyces huiliensis]MBZ4320852.1 XRE family transcriptional regulator [Streptomyces huiliensis]